MSSVKDGVLDVEKFSSFDELINMLEKEVKERRKKFIVQIDELKQEDAQRVFDFLLLAEPNFEALAYSDKSGLRFLSKKNKDIPFLVAMAHFIGQWIPDPC